MVEGPGATRNGRKVQTAVGKAVAVVPDAPANSALAPVLPRHLAGELTGSVLDEAFTVGKVSQNRYRQATHSSRYPFAVSLNANTSITDHVVSSKELFLIFAGARTAPTALRLHFGMTGSLATRKVKANDIGIKTSGVAPWKQHLDPSLRLYFVDENEKQSQFDRASHHIVLEAWGTTVTYPTSVANARNKLMEMSSRDSCSVLFNAQVVFTVIRETGNNLIISDALLDQDIFPGVGNIIKIEGEDAGINKKHRHGCVSVY
jgi:formamidopyrimidine-DNA glycosylase